MTARNFPRLLLSLLVGYICVLGGTEAAQGVTQPSTTQTKSVAIGSAGSAAAPSTPIKKPGVGLNLGPWSYYQPDLPTLDLMKKASPWLTQCAASNPVCTGFSNGGSAWDTKEQANLDLDSLGWVRSLPAPTDTRVKFRSVSTMIFAGGYQPAGRYVVTYKGKGMLQYSGAGIKQPAESTSGRDVVLVSNTSEAGFWLTITRTDPADHLRDIRIYPPGGICSGNPRQHVEAAATCNATIGRFIPYETLAQKQLFSPSYLNDLRGFRTLRFMDWGRTNHNELARWSDRPLPTDRTWASASGVPIETAFALANQVGADPWINIPTHADDNYIAQFGKLAKSLLSEEHWLIVEYSNEPWNQSFPVAKTLLERARAEWPAEINTNAELLKLNFYAKRSAQICQMVKAEFGVLSGRVKCVINTQAAAPASAEAVLTCRIARSDLGKPCSNIFDAVAIAPYFGHYLGELRHRPEITSWYANSDGGLGRFFEEILGVTAEGAPSTRTLAKSAKGTTTGALGLAREWIQSNKLVASRHGLPLWAYEGGQHITQLPYDKDNQFYKLMKAANRDPRIGQAYDRMIKDWADLGGETFVYFTHVDRPSTWGAFGLKESPHDDNAPKWQAALRQRDKFGCWWNGC